MIIFKTWGLKLLYLLWFWSFSVSKFARLKEIAMKTNLMTSSSDDDVIRRNSHIA